MPEQPKQQKRFCNELEAAEYLGLSVLTLQCWRLRKTGPVYCKFGKSVRYSIAELERYAEACRVRPAA
jgi:hypothetical protein